MGLFAFSFHSRRIINLGPVMLISEEQPAQPALPIQPEGTRVVCGHCGNTFLVRSCASVTGYQPVNLGRELVDLRTVYNGMVLSKCTLVKMLKQSLVYEDKESSI